MEALVKMFKHWSITGETKNNQSIVVTGALAPVVCASLGDQEGERDFMDEWDVDNDRIFNMVRMRVFNGLKSDQVTVKWINARTLEITLKWPTWMHNAFIKSAIYDETTDRKKSDGGQKIRPKILHITGQDSPSIKSLKSFIRNRFVREKSNPKVLSEPKRIKDKIRVQYTEDQMTDKNAVWIDVINVEITEDDIDTQAGDVMPDSGRTRLLEIITETKKDNADDYDRTISAGSRNANLGMPIDPASDFVCFSIVLLLVFCFLFFTFPRRLLRVA